MNEIFNMSDKEINYSLFGLMLGDGWLHNRTNENLKMLGIQHSMKQEEYMRWLEDLAKFWGVYRRSYYNKVKQATYGELKYCEMFLTLLDQRHFVKYNRFHSDDGNKIISEYVMKRITPLGLLFWFLDDGNLVVQKRKSESKNPQFDGYKYSRWATISTYSFDRKSHEIAQHYLKERFSIDTKIHQWNPKSKDRGYLKLYIGAQSFRVFFDVVRDYLPYIPDSMKYKFDMKYTSSRSTEIDYLNYNLPICSARHPTFEDEEIVHTP